MSKTNENVNKLPLDENRFETTTRVETICFLFARFTFRLGLVGRNRFRSQTRKRNAYPKRVEQLKTVCFCYGRLADCIKCFALRNPTANRLVSVLQR